MRNLNRIAMVVVWNAVLVGAIFAIMVAAYIGAGYAEQLGVEKLGVRGIGSIVNMLILMLVFVMVIATLLTLAERKWSALMQDRIEIGRAHV